MSNDWCISPHSIGDNDDGDKIWQCSNSGYALSDVVKNSAGEVNGGTTKPP